MAGDHTRTTRTASRARLDRASILAGAMELAATPGVTALSFRELGAHLGADPTAVYRHFRNKDELMSALLDELTARSLAAVDVPEDDWRERLRAMGRATLREFARYPAIAVEATALTTNGPGEHAAIEFMLEALERAGLNGDELVRHYALLAAHILSSCANIARSQAERGLDDGRWLEHPPLVDPREFPRVAAYSARLAELRDDELYLAGIEMLLDSAERAAGGS